MYILQVKFRGKWVWGIIEYEELEKAKERVEKLKRVGIKARVRPRDELYK